MMNRHLLLFATALLCSGMVACAQGGAPCGNEPLFLVKLGARLAPVVDGRATMGANQETPLSIGTGSGVPVGSLGSSQACPVGSVRWSSSNPEVARITPEEGTDVILTTSASGAARITAVVSWNAGSTGRVDATFVGRSTTAYPMCADATSHCIGDWRYLDVTVTR